MSDSKGIHHDIRLMAWAPQACRIIATMLVEYLTRDMVHEQSTSSPSTSDLKDRLKSRFREVSLL